MNTINTTARFMQSFLGPCAEDAGLKTGFVKRRSKLTGSLFVQTLVLGWLSNPNATLEELAQTAAARGVRISPQGLDQRFTMEGAETVRMTLAAAAAALVSGDRVDVSLLNRFAGVYVMDSSITSLPECLKDLWPGCGGSTPSAGASALKFQVMLDLSTGRLTGPTLSSARVNDKATAVQFASLPKGALRIADLGYFAMHRLAAMNDEGVYWLSRLNMQTAVFDERGQELDLPTFLSTKGADEIDRYVFAGKQASLKCRLLAVRIPPEAGAERRRKMRAEAKKQGRPIKLRRLLLADWSLMLTNVPPDLLSLLEAQVLYRARWQIEMLFKLWKSYGKIEQWRSRKPMRILCEVYAKLLAMLVQHWILVASCWAYPERSLVKASATIRRSAMAIVWSFSHRHRLRAALQTIRNCLAFGCHIDKRRKAPATHQILANPASLRREASMGA